MLLCNHKKLVLNRTVKADTIKFLGNKNVVDLLDVEDIRMTS